MFRPFLLADTRHVMALAESKSYLHNAILQATPEQLQLMLYDGAIRFTSQGRDAVLAKDHEKSYEKLTRAQAIVLEMQTGLRPEVNRQVCDQMSALYNFVYKKLVSGSVYKTVQDLDDALKILQHQRETWVMLMEKIAADQPDEGADRRISEPIAAGSLSLEG